jgi:Tfp pilus assembly PilM family ATPase
MDLSRAYLKLVEFLPLENQIAMVAVKPLEISQWNNDRYLSEQIRAALEKHISGDQVELVAAVPAEHAVVRLVEIPVGEENILDALQWDMEQYLAAPLDEFLMDYQAVGPNANESGRVYLVAAYRRSEVDRIKAIFESTGFPLAVLDVDVFAALNAFEVNYPEMVSGRTLVVKADAHCVQCMQVSGGHFQSMETRPVDVGILDLSGEAKTDGILGIIQGIRTSLDAAMDALGEVDNVIVCGDLSLDPEFRELLESNCPIPLIPLDAFKEVAFALSPEKSAVFAPSAPQCAGALGLALRRGGDC